jgi:hypothetical protein
MSVESYGIDSVSKDPETGKRQARPNPPAEWMVEEVPELRIVDDELWNAAKARQVAVKSKRGGDGREEPNSFTGGRAKTAPVQRVSTEVSLNIAEQIEL